MLAVSVSLYARLSTSLSLNLNTFTLPSEKLEDFTFVQFLRLPSLDGTYTFYTNRIKTITEGKMCLVILYGCKRNNVDVDRHAVKVAIT